MNLILASLVALAANQSAPLSPGVHELAFDTRAAGSMLYAISIPKNYEAQRPAPLVLWKITPPLRLAPG